jgi:hypothetical protein
LHIGAENSVQEGSGTREMPGSELLSFRPGIILLTVTIGVPRRETYDT